MREKSTRFQSFHAMEIAPKLFLTYIEPVERSQNIYGMAGGDAHEIVQALEIGKISNKEAVTEWESKMNMYDFWRSKISYN